MTPASGSSRHREADSGAVHRFGHPPRLRGSRRSGTGDPARHLRHHDHALRLDAHDGTATFGQDATFHRTPGLADPTWSSFRAHNSPDRYIRHAGDTLRVDPVATAAERNQATFHVGH
ncbi:AbfB domain-containing protein [Streptomyces sp. NPDC001212]|uniref:AbfB domain-containing protein n=1 Tax=Streptomyces sp. NPDC001312 TaxID=3364561 RepID=UPI0036943086